METAPQNEPTKPEKALPRSWWRHYRRLLIIVGVTLLIAVGGNALWIVTHRPLPTPPQGRQCGTIAHGEYPYPKVSDGPVSAQVVQCFWNAYQHCQAATLNIGYSGVDAGWGTTATIEKSGQQCLIFNYEDVDNNGDISDYVFLCSNMTKQADGLHVSGCGDQRPYVITPFSFTAIKCGVVSNTSPQPDLESAESCFWQEFHSCYAAELTYITRHGTLVDTRHFSVNSACKVAYQHGTHTTTCANVYPPQNDGLLFIRCGKEQKVLVPLPPQQ